ncbi:MAG: hydrolase [Geminicoccaceae bacterium]
MVLWPKAARREASDELIEAARSALLVVDVQQNLAPAMHEAEACLESCHLLVEAARRLDIPVLATEQYPKGLGPTVPELAALLPRERTFAKQRFSCAADPKIRAALTALGRFQVMICGIEAHVSVLQSALGLKALGLRPVVVADAIASRLPQARELALARLRAHGVEIVNAEMVVFEWLREAGTPDFKALIPLIK